MDNMDRDIQMEIRSNSILNSKTLNSNERKLETIKNEIFSFEAKLDNLYKNIKVEIVQLNTDISKMLNRELEDLTLIKDMTTKLLPLNDLIADLSDKIDNHFTTYFNQLNDLSSVVKENNTSINTIHDNLLNAEKNIITNIIQTRTVVIQTVESIKSLISKELETMKTTTNEISTSTKAIKEDTTKILENINTSVKPLKDDVSNVTTQLKEISTSISQQKKVTDNIHTKLSETIDKKSDIINSIALYVKNQIISDVLPKISDIIKENNKDINAQLKNLEKKSNNNTNNTNDNNNTNNISKTHHNKNRNNHHHGDFDLDAKRL
ncbi:MAG: hypothetical protein [Cotesia congregata filamentous virus 2]